MSPIILYLVKTPKEEEISDKTEFSFYHLLNRAAQDKNILNNLEDINALVTYSTSIDTLDNPREEKQRRDTSSMNWSFAVFIKQSRNQRRFISSSFLITRWKT